MQTHKGRLKRAQLCGLLALQAVIESSAGDFLAFNDFSAVEAGSVSPPKYVKSAERTFQPLFF